MLVSTLLINDEDREKFPQMFEEKESPADRSSRTQMRVIIFGMPRTATSSIMEALNQLNVAPTYHMSTLKQYPEDSAFWERAAKAKFCPESGEIAPTSDEWRQFLGHYQAVIDAPGAAFTEEIMEAFPNTPVVIAQREANSWLASYRKTIGMPADDWLLKLEPYLQHQTFIVRELIFSGMVGTYKLDGTKALDEQTKENYLRMYEHVRSVVPKQRKVEYNIKQGWAPLCQLLGQPIPKTPFPHVNDTPDFRRIKELGLIMSLDHTVFRAFQVLLLALGIYLLVVRYSG